MEFFSCFCRNPVYIEQAPAFPGRDENCASYKHNIAFSKKWLYAITIIIIRKLLVLINQSSSGDLIYFDNKFFDKAKEPDVYEIKKRTLRFQRFFIFLLFFFYFYFSRKKVVLAE